MPSPPGPPMTLGNMRELGVRSLAVTCELCHHEGVLSADGWADDVPVRAFRPRMVCTQCGIVGADARPNWREMKASGNWESAAHLSLGRDEDLARNQETGDPGE